MRTLDWIAAGLLGAGGLVLLLAIFKAILGPFFSRDLFARAQLASKRRALLAAQKEAVIGNYQDLLGLFFLSTKRTSLQFVEKVHEYNLSVLEYLISIAPSARGIPNLAIVEELFFNRFLLFQQLEKSYTLKAKISAYNKVKKASFDEKSSIPNIKDSIKVNKRSLEKELRTLLSSLNELLAHHDATIH